MDDQHVQLTDVVEVDEEYKQEVQDLKQNIEERDIPSWILIPKRNSGEHATGAGWLGVVMARCSEGSGTINARVAIDVEDRDRVQSNVGSVPDILLDNIKKATEAVDRGVELCIARVKYDCDTRDLESVNLLLRLEEETEEDEDQEE